MKWLRKNKERRFFSTATTEEIFNWIYKTNKWGDAESISGSGSSLRQTAALRRELRKLLKELEIATLLDIPCGDFHWMQHVAPNVKQYIGADIVAELIENLNRTFKNSSRTFVQLDITRDPLPACDAILSRDCLVHLCFADIGRAIENIQSGSYRYLITTTHTLIEHNRDKLTGKHRCLNLQRPPFSWPEPITAIKEDTAGKDTGKCLAVWRAEDISPILF